MTPALQALSIGTLTEELKFHNENPFPPYFFKYIENLSVKDLIQN